jgi:hypothetical protein
MAHALFIHGLDNKPEADYLYQLWKRKLAHEDGPDLDGNGIGSAMAYWADVFYASPDTNLAAYESAAGDIETLDEGPTPPLDLARAPRDHAARVRRLADKVGVDPEAPSDYGPSAAEVAAVRQERVPVPEWLRKRIMSRFVRDAHHYFYNQECTPREGCRYLARDEMRKRVLDGLKAGAAQRPLVVVSHSMGTIMAYDCLMHEPDCPEVDGLMTVGSPLGLDEVQDFFPSWSRANGFPSAKLKGAWVNVYDPLDVVAGFVPRFAGDFMRDGLPVVEDVREDNWGTWRHSISKYLQGKLLRGQLAKMLKLDWT